jgi:hypothetical protein
MNPIILLFLISLLAKDRTRRDKLKVAMVIMAVILGDPKEHPGNKIQAYNASKLQRDLLHQFCQG